VKAHVTAYGRFLASSTKILDIQPGAYLTNYTLQSPPRPSNPNEFTFGLAMPGDAPLPVIDMEEDYGKYVVGPLEYALGGEGEERWKEVETIHAAPEYITPDEMCQAFSQGQSSQTSHLLPPNASHK
jgi:hypothetical protein